MLVLQGTLKICNYKNFQHTTGWEVTHTFQHTPHEYQILKKIQIYFCKFKFVFTKEYFYHAQRRILV